MQSNPTFTFECGCQVLGETLDYNGGIRYCQLHSAAPDLLEALEEADALLGCLVDQDWRDMNLPIPNNTKRRAAIAKARKESEPLDFTSYEGKAKSTQIPPPDPNLITDSLEQRHKAKKE